MDPSSVSGREIERLWKVRGERVRTGPGLTITEGDAAARLQLPNEGVQPLERVGDVCEMLLDDGEPEFPFLAARQVTRVVTWSRCDLGTIDIKGGAEGQPRVRRTCR
jgi:hypothetical protein